MTHVTSFDPAWPRSQESSIYQTPSNPLALLAAQCSKLYDYKEAPSDRTGSFQPWRPEASSRTWQRPDYPKPEANYAYTPAPPILPCAGNAPVYYSGPSAYSNPPQLASLNAPAPWWDVASWQTDVQQTLDAAEQILPVQPKLPLAPLRVSFPQPAPPLPVRPKSGKRYVKPQCECPTCQGVDRLELEIGHVNIKRTSHNCHVDGCGKVGFKLVFTRF